MDFKGIINEAVNNGQNALSEFDSKKILSAYSLPTPKEALVKTSEDAVQQASEIGYPVVLKACSHNLMHKSEGGFVEIYLNNELDVKEAYDRIMDKAESDIDGILVQEMASGQRELVLGFLRDPQFGPCVILHRVHQYSPVSLAPQHV